MKTTISTGMKATALAIVMLMAVTLKVGATGWPAHYGGVMLQGFYWHSYDDTRWSTLLSHVDDYSKYFDVIWVPQSGKLSYDQTGMGYQPYYWFDHNTAAFGSQNELTSMVRAYKDKGTNIIEDVVINHHCSRNELDYFFFPTETNPEDGTEWTLLPSDICANDDGGNAKSMLRGDQHLSVNNDEGEDFSYGRDIDHKSIHAQNLIKAYEHFLVSTLGYTGFRYDMVKGFNGQHVADYNYNTAQTTMEGKGKKKHSPFRFSVGEYWDSSIEKVTNWINSTIRDSEGKTDVDNGKNYTKDVKAWDEEYAQGHIYSAAFDYPLKHGAINSAFATGDFSKGGNKFVNFGIADGASPANSRYAITFVENHDTYYPRDDNTVEDNNMAKLYPMAANALILAIPGTPCLYLKHWLDESMRKELEKMIMARKACGVTNMSLIEERNYDIDDDGYYVIVDSDPYAPSGMGNPVGEKDHEKGGNKILVTFGDVSKTGLTEGYTLVSPATEAEAKKLGYHFYIKAADGTTGNANAVTRYQTYTSATQTDNPYVDDVANDNKVYAQDTIHHKEMVNLDKTIYVHRVESPEVAPYIFTWSPELAGGWPGTQMTKWVNIKGEKYWYHTFTSGEALNFVISDGGTEGSGKNQNQTSDITGITGDSYIVWDDTYKNDWKDKDNNAIVHWTLTTGTEKAAQIDPDSIFMSNQTLTVFFTKPAGWTSGQAPRVYAYNASGAFTAVAPGDTMKEVGLIDGKTVWRWSYTGDKYDYTDPATAPTKLVFTDGVSSTNALTFENQKYYDGTTLDAGTMVTPTLTASASVPDGLSSYSKKFTIWAEAPAALGTPRLHIWYDGGAFTDWQTRPAMDFVKTLDNGHNLFRWDYNGTVTNTPTGLKITCGASETGNLTYSATANYYKLDEPLKINAPKYTVYFKKPAGWWGTPCAWVYKDGGENLVEGLGYSWPGQPMEEVGKINGESVYKWSYFGTSTTVPDKVIFAFSDNTLNPRTGKTTYEAQTDALTFEDGKLYNGSRRPASCVKADGDPYTAWLVLPGNVEKGYAWPVTKDWKDNYTQNAWPGDEMSATSETVDGLNVVKWTYNASITSEEKQAAAKDNPPYMAQLIFKENGRDNKWQFNIAKKWDNDGPTVPFVDGGFYDQDEQKNVKATDMTITPTDKVCAYFFKPKDWTGTISAYVWGGGATYAGWPGEEMTKVADVTIDGVKKELYKWTYTGDATTLPTNIIFNNKKNNDNGAQTSDLVFKNGNVYEYSANIPATTPATFTTPTDQFNITLQQPHGWQQPTIVMKSADAQTAYSAAQPGSQMRYITTLTDETGTQQDVYNWIYAGDHAAPASADAKVSFYVGSSLVGTEQDYQPYYSFSGFDVTTYPYTEEMYNIGKLVNRVFNEKQNSTVILPFDVSEVSLTDINAKVYEFTSIDNNGLLTFTRRTTGGLTAGVPYFVIAKQTGKLFNRVARRTVTNIVGQEGEQQWTPATNASAFNVYFTGNLGIETEKVTSTADKTFYGYDGADGTFRTIKVGRRANIPSTICYFYTTAKSGTTGSAKLTTLRFVDYEDGTTTDIPILSDGGITTTRTTNDAIYNLQGQRVNGTLQPGIYIRGGKKVIVK